MSGLVVRDLHVSFGEHQVLAGVDLHVEAGTVTAVLGASGCGKTTLLRAVAGFVTPGRGEIALAGRLLTAAEVEIPPERRGIGLVPQEAALFGHLDVAGNVGFGLSRSARRDGTRVAELLDLVGLGGFAGRRPDELSGGQQQRVALARALAPRPDLVLLDEPFSALDAGLREAVRADVRDVLRRAGATAVVVTHDQDEALSMADSVAVMDGGRILMHAAPDQVYRRPNDLAVARFVGQVVELDAVLDGDRARTVLGAVPVDPASDRSGEPVGDAAGPRRGLLVLRPEQLVLLAPGEPGGVPGRVVESTYYGHDATHLVHLATREDGPPVPVLVRTLPGERPGTVVRVAVRGAGRYFPR